MRGVLCALVASACSFHAHEAADGGSDTAGAAGHCLTTTDGTWCRRRSITIPATMVTGGPHADFPVLVSLTADGELAADARTDGFDLLFTDAGGGPLDYERESFDPTTGALLAWVRLPMLANDAPTTFYLWDGNAGAPDQARPSAVWDADYEAVLHLDEAIGGTSALRDSTVRGNHATDTNGPLLAQPGAIGGAVRLDGIDDRLVMTASASLGSTAAEGTFELWLSLDSDASGAYQFVLCNSTWSTGWEWASQPGGAHYFYPWRGDTSNYDLGPDPFTTAGWHQAVVTYNSRDRSVAIYIDGTAMTFTTTNVPTHWTQVAALTDWLWGGNPALAGSHVAGLFDEIRVSDRARAPEWIATAYRNQHAPSAFYMLGAVEVLAH